MDRSKNYKYKKMIDFIFFSMTSTRTFVGNNYKIIYTIKLISVGLQQILSKQEARIIKEITKHLVG